MSLDQTGSTCRAESGCPGAHGGRSDDRNHVEDPAWYLDDDFAEWLILGDRAGDRFGKLEMNLELLQLLTPEQVGRALRRYRPNGPAGTVLDLDDHRERLARIEEAG